MSTDQGVSSALIPTADADGQALRRQVASSIARLVTPSGQLGPEHDAAAAAVLQLLEERQLLVTEARLRHVTAQRLLAIADGPMHDLDLWDTGRVQVELWLRDRAIELQRVDRTRPRLLRPAA